MSLACLQINTTTALCVVRSYYDPPTSDCFLVAGFLIGRLVAVAAPHLPESEWLDMEWYADPAYHLSGSDSFLLAISIPAEGDRRCELGGGHRACWYVAHPLSFCRSTC